MNKKFFALSWGRKSFFGLGFLLTAIMGLTYVQSMLFPSGGLSWFYFFVTFIGHYGFLISVFYFLLYVPVIYLFPGYYMSKIWSAILLIALNLFIFVDGYLFSNYRLHLNPLVFKFIDGEQFSKSSLVFLLIGSFVVFLILWIRGERLWRIMQARFSNPVKNWYLVVILICFFTGLTMEWQGAKNGDVVYQKLSQLFPLRKLWVDHLYAGTPVLKTNSIHPKGYKEFNYPVDNLKCDAKNPKNIVIFSLSEWKSGVKADQAYLLKHISTHAINFPQHLSGSDKLESSWFSLLYSLPPVYEEAVKIEEIKPFFIEQLIRNKFEMRLIKSGFADGLISQLYKGLKSTEVTEIEGTLEELTSLNRRFFLNVTLRSGSLREQELIVSRVLEMFSRKHLIDQSIVLILGSTAQMNVDAEHLQVDQFKAPAMMIWNSKKEIPVKAHTSHYDFIPTIVQEDWKCKINSNAFSFGSSLFRISENDYLTVGNYHQLGVINLQNQQVSTLYELKDLKLAKGTSPKLILKSLKELMIFQRRR
jgi:membrane-anchored protein YejM (alkaline phosphatase superfamily)